MTRYLTVDEVLHLHTRILERSGGMPGTRDEGLPESAVAQPRATFERHDLYSDVFEKAAALGAALVLNHPFVDGNKRVGHAAIEAFLAVNGFELSADVADQEDLFLRLAAGNVDRAALSVWIAFHAVPLAAGGDSGDSPPPTP